VLSLLWNFSWTSNLGRWPERISSKTLTFASISLGIIAKSSLELPKVGQLGLSILSLNSLQSWFSKRYLLEVFSIAFTLKSPIIILITRHVISNNLEDFLDLWSSALIQIAVVEPECFVTMSFKFHKTSILIDFIFFKNPIAKLKDS